MGKKNGAEVQNTQPNEHDFVLYKNVIGFSKLTQSDPFVNGASEELMKTIIVRGNTEIVCELLSKSAEI